MPEQATFTAGPWLLDLHPKRSFVRTEEHGAIADVWTSREGGKENATLICAAPELYAACKKFCDYYSGAKVSMLGNGQARKSFDEFAAALAKADDGVQS